MRFYRCDRCGREYTVNMHDINEGALGLRNPTETCLTIDLPTDLCDACRKDFEAWFRQPRMDKAMEEARAKAHEHKNGEVTVLGLEDGRVICPVCGEVFEMFSQFPVTFSNGSVFEKNIVICNCPKCGIRLNTQHINYINLKENKDNEQQLDAKKTSEGLDKKTT